MNLQQFKKKHPAPKYTVTKKLFFDQYPIKIKVPWDGCSFLVYTRRRKNPIIPAWVKFDNQAGPAEVNLRGRNIVIDPTKFRTLYKYLTAVPPDKMRCEEMYSNSALHLYFLDFAKASEFLTNFPFNELVTEISVPHVALATGQVVVLKPIIDAGYQYRVNLKAFHIRKEDRAKYANIFANFGDDIKLPASFANLLYNPHYWSEKRNVWWLSNKYFYAKDLSAVTYLALAFPKLVRSVNDLVSHKDVTWQSSMNKLS